MSRYRPRMIDGMAGLSLGPASPAPPPPHPGAARLRAAQTTADGGAQAGEAEAHGPEGRTDADSRSGIPGATYGGDWGAAALARARSALAGQAMIAGEPDSERGTLSEWRAWRTRLLTLPRDESVRLALAVAEARIAKLRERAGE